MTADPAFGHLTPLRSALHFGAPSLDGTRPLSRRGGNGRIENNTTARWRRHSGFTGASSFQDVDPLAYSAEDPEEHAVPCEPHDSREDVHDLTILELSGDSPDDHWALAPEQIDDMTCESMGDTH